MEPPRNLLRFGVLASAAVAIASGVWLTAELSDGRSEGNEYRDRSDSAGASVSKNRAKPGTEDAGLSEFVSADNPSGTKPADLLAAFRDASAISDPLDSAVRLRAVLRTLSAEDIPQAIAAARHLPESSIENVLRAIGRRFAEIDVKLAVAYAREHPSKPRYSSVDSLLCGVVELWARRAPDEAVAWVDALPRSERRYLLQTLVDSLGNTEPRSAAALLHRNPTEEGIDFLTRRLFEKWSSRSVEEATAFAHELKGKQRVTALGAIGETLASRDPHMALDWAAKLEDPVARSRVIYEIGARWAVLNPSEALEWAGGASVDNPALRAVVRGQALAELVRVDADAGLAYIRALPQGAEREELTIRAAASLGNSNPKMAIALTQELPDTPTRTGQQIEWCKEWAKVEPKDALEWFFHNVPSDTVERYGLHLGRRNDIASSIAGWCADAPDEAVEWAARLEGAHARDLATAAVVCGFAAFDVDRAKEMFSELTSKAQHQAIWPMLENLTSADLDSTLSWVERLPEGQVRLAALYQVAVQVGIQDPYRATKWVQSLAAGPSRDKAITGIAVATVEYDPQRAADWGATISSPTERTQVLEQIARSWMSRSPTAAQQWVQQTPHLNPDQKTRLLAQPAGARR